MKASKIEIKILKLKKLEVLKIMKTLNKKGVPILIYNLNGFAGFEYQR